MTPIFRPFALAVAMAAASCAGNDEVPSCWTYECPSAPSSNLCGTCVHPGIDDECEPGFVCSCSSICVKGPRSYDAGYCAPDAGPADPSMPDARMYDWPVCDTSHLPGT